MAVFVFTDLVGSTSLKKHCPGQTATERDASYYRLVLEPHRNRIYENLDSRCGNLESNLGDGHFLVFDSPNAEVDAVCWAIGLQESHQNDPIVAPNGVSLGVKIGISRGRAHREAGLIIGRRVDMAARLSDYATGGQILCSESVAGIIYDEEVFGIRVHPHGKRLLKGVGDCNVFEVLYGDRNPQPLRGDDKLTILPGDVREFTRLSRRRPSSSQGRQQGNDSISLYGFRPSTEMTWPKNLGSGVKLGKYELVEQIGAGGMGVVWLAHHQGMNRQCVVKVIRPDFLDSRQRDEVIDRFYREVIGIAQLQHPNIVSAYDSSSREDYWHFLVMEYVNGKPLDQLVSQSNPIEVGASCELIRQAAMGLQYIHEQGVVHRDIKPSNLMLTRDGLVKILDLGLALLVRDSQGRLTQDDCKAVGTADYMAPEQWQTTSVDIRADIYSLGCTFYHLLSGAPPFAQSQFKHQIAHAHEPIPPFAKQLEVADEVQRILLKMLEKDPERRYATPRDVAAALEPHADVLEARSLVDRRPIGVPAGDTVAAISTNVDTSRMRKTKGPIARYVNVTAVVLLLVVLVIIGLKYLQSGQHGDELGELRAEVVGLPGLNGEWWFDEFPYYCPVVREWVAQKISEGRIHIGNVNLVDLQEKADLGDVNPVYDKLRQLAEAYDNTKVSGTVALNYLSQLLQERTIMDVAYQDTLLSYINDLPIHSSEPTRVHQRALFQHQLATVGRVGWEDADKSYDAAIRGYRKNGDAELLTLCYADKGRLLRDFNRNYIYEDSYAQVLRNESTRNLARADAYLQMAWGDVKTRNPEAALEKIALAQKCLHAVDTGHPLKAFAEEVRGWALLKNWQPISASEAFHNSARLRRTDDPNTSNLRRRLLSLLGEAMSLHLMGMQRDALYKYKEALTLATGAGVQGDVEERLTNILERTAECFLFSDYADDSPQWRKDVLGRFDNHASEKSAAVVALETALDKAYELRFPFTKNAPYLRRIQFKLCIAYHESGCHEKAKELLKRIENQEQRSSNEQTLSVSPEQREVFHKEEQLARALIALHGNAEEHESGLNGLMAIIDGDVEKSLTRGNLGLYLFVVGRLANECESEHGGLLNRASRQLRMLAVVASRGGEINDYLLPTVQRMQLSLASNPTANDSEKSGIGKLLGEIISKRGANNPDGKEATRAKVK